MTYENTPEPPLEPPEDIIFAYCDYCGGEIYDGETYYAINGETICTDCLRDFASGYFADCVEEASVHAQTGMRR